MTNSGSALQKSSSPKKGRKYFTLSEAGRALALVRRIVADVRSSNNERLRIHAAMNADLSSQDTLQLQFNRESDRLDLLIDELTKIGVELKDRSRGLVDFPSIHEGREINLCWESDEKTIGFWHEMDAGVAGRRPVSELHDAS